MNQQSKLTPSCIARKYNPPQKGRGWGGGERESQPASQSVFLYLESLVITDRKEQRSQGKYATQHYGNFLQTSD
jgi:hypothetical protein